MYGACVKKECVRKALRTLTHTILMRRFHTETVSIQYKRNEGKQSCLEKKILIEWFQKRN